MRDSNSTVVSVDEKMVSKTYKSDLNVAGKPAASPGPLYTTLVVIIYLQWVWMASLIGLIFFREGINN